MVIYMLCPIRYIQEISYHCLHVQSYRIVPVQRHTLIRLQCVVEFTAVCFVFCFVLFFGRNLLLVPRICLIVLKLPGSTSVIMSWKLFFNYSLTVSWVKTMFAALENQCVVHSLVGKQWVSSNLWGKGRISISQAQVPVTLKCSLNWTFWVSIWSSSDLILSDSLWFHLIRSNTGDQQLKLAMHAFNQQ